MGIDAVMVESEPAYTGCEVCPRIQYAVTRHPPFTAGRVITDVPYLNDRWVRNLIVICRRSNVI